MGDYLAHASAITYIVIATLSFYFIATFYIFLYRYRLINYRLKIEHDTLNRLYNNPQEDIAITSVFYNFLHRLQDLDKQKLLEAAINDTLRASTKGLTQLSIMASTAPFIGLFGTVVGILEAFGRLGNVKSATLNVVAPAISEALIATAFGIFVAIFAYMFHLLLKRKVYELNSILNSIVNLLLSREK